MKRIKQFALAALCVSPAAAFAAGSATGSVTLEISSALGDVFLVETSGVKTGNPACSTGFSPYQFLLPKTAAFYSDILSVLLGARQSGTNVTVTGTGTCSINGTIETIAGVTW